MQTMHPTLRIGREEQSIVDQLENPLPAHPAFCENILGGSETVPNFQLSLHVPDRHEARWWPTRHSRIGDDSPFVNAINVSSYLTICIHRWDGVSQDGSRDAEAC